MSGVSSYRDLKVWQRSVDLAVEIYRLTRAFPGEETYGLTSQVRRAGISVGANISEGSGRATSKDLMSFLSHSRGSLKEAESLVFVAQRLDYVTPAQCVTTLDLTEEVSMMLAGLRASIARRGRRTSP